METTSSLLATSIISRSGCPNPLPLGISLAATLKNLPELSIITSLSVVCAWSAICSASSSLNLNSSVRLTCPFRLRIHPFCDKITVIGSFSISASSGTSISSATSENSVRRRPSAVFLPNFSFICLISAAIASQRLPSSPSSSSNPAFSSDNSSDSSRIWLSSSLRSERSYMFKMASDWLSVSLNSFIMTALGSSSSRII